MISEDYKQFVNEKILEYLPSSKVFVHGRYNMRCPICGDSHKSMTKKRGWYYPDTCSYFCFNCSTAMTGLKFLEFLSGDNFDEIKAEYIKYKIKHNSDPLNIVKKYDTELSCMSKIHPIVNKVWKNELTEDAKNYLKNRLVFDAPFLKDKKFFSVYDKENNEYIFIPWIVNGTEAYYQINDFKKVDKFGRKYSFPKDTEKLIYGLDDIDISWPYIICFEGVYDSLFVKNGVCIGGKFLTAFQEKLLKERYPRHQIVLSFDNDEAGLTAMKKSIIEHPIDFKYFKWFSGETKQKDINDFVLSSGNVHSFENKEDLEKMIVSSIEMKVFLIQKGYAF